MIMVSEFKKEVLNWAEEIGVNPKEIQIREMRKKWASCSSKGRLSFSYELLNQNYDQRTQAIVHELLHLRHPNHGKMFLSLLVSYLSRKGIDCKNIKL